MKSEYIIYSVYILFFLLLVGATFVVPFMAFDQNMDGAYHAFGYTCHQKLSRSYCIFKNVESVWIADCTDQNGSFVNTKQDRTTIEVNDGTIIGYKIPICARDVGIYSALLIGGLVYPLVRKLNDRYVYPAIYLILAIVPLGLDGTVQLLSEIGILPFLYESTNTIRLVTGLIAGFVSAFYAIPILMNMFGGRKR
jgi:uncharacterized membrane protein